METQPSWLRFSLRTLFAMVTLSAGIGWLIHHHRQGQDVSIADCGSGAQWDIVFDELESHGITVTPTETNGMIHPIWVARRDAARAKEVIMASKRVDHQVVEVFDAPRRSGFW